MKQLSFIFWFLIIGFSVMAQKVDTIKPLPSNVVKKVENDTLHSPKRAAWLSTALPGLGQAYNKKYWKIPVIWAGLGASVYFFTTNRSQFLLYKEAYLAEVTGDPQFVNRTDNPFLSEASLLQESETYRKRMEYSVIGFAGIYLLNIVDAAVDAHFFYFDVSDDLSLNVRPTIVYDMKGFSPPKNGLSLTLNF